MGFEGPKRVWRDETDLANVKSDNVKNVIRGASRDNAIDLGDGSFQIDEAAFRMGLQGHSRQNLGNLSIEDLGELEGYLRNNAGYSGGIADEVQTQRQKLEAEKGRTELSNKRKERLDRLMKAEAGLTEGLLGAQRATEDAINDQLSQLIQETGIAAGVARQQVGGQYAEAGLSRSTFAQQGIEDVTSSEIDRKGAQRLAASEQVSNVRRTTDQALYDIKTRRERAREAAELDQEGAFQEQVQALEKEQINRFYSTAVENLGLNTQDAAYMANLTGGIFAGAGQLFGRYMTNGGENGEQS